MRHNSVTTHTTQGAPLVTYLSTNSHDNCGSGSKVTGESHGVVFGWSWRVVEQRSAVACSSCSSNRGVKLEERLWRTAVV